MTNTEKIRQEIERQMSLWWEKLPDADKDTAIWTQDEAKALGEYVAYESLLDFIDSLPEEKHERLPNINCVWYKDGECKKGLPETKCDVVGCVAYISKAESILIDKRGKRIV